MTYTFVSLEEALRDLPTLSKVLGQKWIERESNTPPLESDFLLARLLRTRELRHLAVSLDSSLYDLWYVEGASDWRKRLRSNGEEFRALLSETSFALVLLRCGIQFTHPTRTAGPDFAVTIGDAPPIHLEVTTPHATIWSDDLDARLWFLSRQYSHSLRTESIADDVPILHEEIDRNLMRQIVRDSEVVLKSATPNGAPIAQEWHDIGLRIIWTPSSDPFVSGTNPPSMPLVHPFKFVLTAAKKKVEQMEKGDAHTLVIGRNMLPFPEFEQYVDSVKNNVPFYGQFDWNQIPRQVKHLFLFRASYDVATFPSVVVCIRPGEEHNLPEGFDYLLEALQRAETEHQRQDAQETVKFLELVMRHEAQVVDNESENHV